MIITCSRSHFEERCLQRGYSLFRAAGCVVSSSGDVLAVDTDHVDYPAEVVGALGFKCVPDCTTPEFACGSGECCVEFSDGTNGCQACVSSSSSGSSSSSVCAVQSGSFNEYLGRCETKQSIAVITNHCLSNAVLVISGSVDDEVLIDGVIYEAGQYPFPWDSYPGAAAQCGAVTGDNGSHEFTYTKILGPNESVSVGAKDNCCGGGITATWTLTSQ